MKTFPFVCGLRPSTTRLGDNARPYSRDAWQKAGRDHGRDGAALVAAAPAPAPAAAAAALAQPAAALALALSPTGLQPQSHRAQRLPLRNLRTFAPSTPFP